MTPNEEEIINWEGRLIIQIKRVADVNAKLMKQLVHGHIDSELVGSYMDLRNIATQLESITKYGRTLNSSFPARTPE